ncbi:MAG: EAL domain-containing protein [Thermoanaerobaculia bacterium]|nr:EAL domain-containing protein [Thermoanaerobaculia bacterium]
MSPKPTLLDRLLAPDGLRTWFQPIFDFSDGQARIRGAECLTRGLRGSNLESADVLFSYAREKRAEVVVDRTVVSRAVSAIEDLDEDLDYHLNVHASTLGLDPSFPEHLVAEGRKRGIAPSRITVEIVEATAHLDQATFSASVDSLREHGFTIALDDVGLGRSNYLMIYLTRPDVLKVDRFFVDQIGRDPLRHAVFVSIQRLGEELGARVIAEGVEREEDLEVLQDLGVQEFQGYLWSRPKPRESFLGELGSRSRVE